MNLEKINGNTNLTKAKAIGENHNKFSECKQILNILVVVVKIMNLKFASAYEILS